MPDILTKYKLAWTIKGDGVPPADVDDEAAAKEEAMAIIRLYMEDSQLPFVADCEDPAELWECLKRIWGGGSAFGAVDGFATCCTGGPRFDS